MKNTLHILFFFLMPLCGLAQPQVNYKVFYGENMENTGLKVNVSVELKKAADSTYFHYSNNLWGEDQIMQCLSGLAGKNQAYQFKLVPDSNRIVVYHPKSKYVSFDYFIKQDYPGDAMDIVNRPRVKNQFFHILGQSLFVVPELIFEKKEADPSLIAQIEWMDFPANFVIHNTFGSSQKKQLLKVKLWSQFYHSLFVGGDYRIYPFEHHRQPIFLAVRGEWQTYDDQTLLEKLKRTVVAQREFWKDDNFEYYTVIITPTVTQQDSSFKGQSTTGSGVHNGFMIQSSNNPFNRWGVIDYILNHEMMHDWIGGKITMKSEELNYWFSEGFTDYYTYKNRLHSGDMNFEQWLRDFNKDVIEAHYKNPQRNQPNYTVKDNFWKDRNFEKIPYRRGAIFAFWLDQKIIKKSNNQQSLDDLMRELLFICTTENKKFSDELFLDVAQKIAGEDLGYFFQKHIINGVDIPFEPDTLIEGFSIEKKENIPVIKADEAAVKRYLGKK